MRIRQVQVQNFRGFQAAKIHLPDTGLVLVAGANNSGKTALLSTLDAIAGDNGDIATLRHRTSEEPALIRATFDLDWAERSVILDGFSDRDKMLDQGMLSSLQFFYEQWQDQELKLREVSGSWSETGLRPLASMTPSQGVQATQEIIQAFNFDPRNQTSRGSIQEILSGQNSLTRTGTQEYRQGLDNYMENQPILARIWDLLVAWRSRLYHFRALRPGTQRELSLGSPEKLNPTGDNLSGVLHYLATDDPLLFEKVQALIAQVVPEIGTLRVRTRGNVMRVVFESTAGDLNLKDQGTGVEQLLMTIVAGLTETAPLTMVIEEPETNLNPAAQRAVLGLLQDWSTDRLIIAATHSPVMLDWSPAGDRLWLVTRQQGASHVEPVSTDPLPVLEALGVRLSDVLSADRVLVLEGASDEDILQVWYPKVLRDPRVAILGGHGGDNAIHADQLAEWLAGADRVGLRRVLYLRDRDELAPGKLERLEQSPTVHVLERREIENYLLDPSAIASVIQSLLPSDTHAPDTQAIATAMNEIAEELREKIIINRVARRVAAPMQLMDNKLRQRLARDRVDLSAFTNSVVERLMTPDELKAQIATAWSEESIDVEGHSGEALLKIAPGEEIMDTMFLRYLGRHYKKREDGPLAAAAMSAPAELTQLLDDFMAD